MIEKNVLTDEEVETIIVRVMEGRESKRASEEELDQIIQWAHRTKVSATLLELLLLGEVIVLSVGKDGEPLFSLPKA